MRGGRGRSLFRQRAPSGEAFAVAEYTYETEKNIARQIAHGRYCHTGSFLVGGSLLLFFAGRPFLTRKGEEGRPRAPRHEMGGGRGFSPLHSPLFSCA